MRQYISLVALVVRDYDEAIAFFRDKLNFTVVEDTYQPAQDKRWVVVAPPGGQGTSLLLARAVNAQQMAARQPDGWPGLPVPDDGRLPAGLRRHDLAWNRVRARTQSGAVRDSRRVSRRERQPLGSFRAGTRRWLARTHMTHERAPAVRDRFHPVVPVSRARFTLRWHNSPANPDTTIPPNTSHLGHRTRTRHLRRRHAHAGWPPEKPCAGAARRRR